MHRKGHRSNAIDEICGHDGVPSLETSGSDCVLNNRSGQHALVMSSHAALLESLQALSKKELGVALIKSKTRAKAVEGKYAGVVALYKRERKVRACMQNVTHCCAVSQLHTLPRFKAK